MMIRRAVAAVAAGGVLVAVGAGCGDGDGIPPASDPVPADVDSERAVAARAAADTCVPGAMRECRMSYVGPDGRKNCPPSLQFCQPHGRGWHECGDFDMDDDGNPHPPGSVRPRK